MSDLDDAEFLESLRQDFVLETMDNLAKCEECLLKFETNKEDAALREYLRVLHSIKGSARAVEFDKIATTVHQIESLGQKSAEAQFVEISLASIDRLREVMDLIKDNDQAEIDRRLDDAIKKAAF